MKRYLVGGAVRDELLGRAVCERDWVVVGASEEDMLAQGYLPVAANMPVFIDPVCKEEHALARLERKTGPGHKGFLFTSSPEVTLEQDLTRRDLTINAIARSEDGELTDPCGGQEDLRRRLLRHISPAFAEDPLRVLRVARFAAELAAYGFRVAPQTLALMGEIVGSGELRTLPAERVWREAEKALQSEHPREFFRTLHQCGALAALMDGLQWQRQGVEQNLSRAVAGDCEPPWRWAAIAAALDSGAAEKLQQALQPPGRFARPARLAVRLLPQLHRSGEPTPAERLEVFERADAFRRPEDFAQLLQLAQSLNSSFALCQWRQALQRLEAVRLPPNSELKGAAYGEALRSARLAALAHGDSQAR